MSGPDDAVQGCGAVGEDHLQLRRVVHELGGIIGDVTAAIQHALQVPARETVGPDEGRPEEALQDERPIRPGLHA